MSEKSEQKLQIKLCNYIQNFYPNVYFSSDPSGLRVTPGLRSILKATRSRHAHLDVELLEPSKDGKYHALIIECKKVSPLKKNNTISEEKHIQEQVSVMNMLRSKGYYCMFCWSLEGGINIVNEYLGAPEIDNSPLF